MSNTRPRQRRRGPAEQMFWDHLSPREKVAFTIGYAVGQGADFPSLERIEALRQQLGDDRALLCTACRRPLPLPVPGSIGRPPKKCSACRGLLPIPATPGPDPT